MSETTNDIWILGAAGRSGTAIATELANMGLSLTFVGRNAETLKKAARDLNVAVETVAASTIEEKATAIPRARHGECRAQAL
jgi:short-subunit dehydrogenase